MLVNRNKINVGLSEISIIILDIIILILKKYVSSELVKVNLNK